MRDNYNNIYAIFPEVDTWTHAIILHYHQSSNVCDILNYANVFIFVCVRLCVLFYESCVRLFPGLKCVIILTKSSYWNTHCQSVKFQVR